MASFRLLMVFVIEVYRFNKYLPEKDVLAPC
jgi:hypothetical protein